MRTALLAVIAVALVVLAGVAFGAWKDSRCERWKEDWGTVAINMALADGFTRLPGESLDEALDRLDPYVRQAKKNNPEPWPGC